MKYNRHSKILEIIEKRHRNPRGISRRIRKEG